MEKIIKVAIDLMGHDFQEVAYAVQFDEFHVGFSVNEDAGIIMTNENALTLAHAIIAHFTKDQPK